MKSKKQLVRDGMIAFLQNAEEDYKKKTTTTSARKIKVKAKEMWEFINDKYPQVAETKYRPSTLKSIWLKINSKFNNKFEMLYDIKQGPLPKGKTPVQKALLQVQVVSSPLSSKDASIVDEINDTKASTEVSETEAKADVEHDLLWSTISALEPSIYETDDFSYISEDFSMIDSLDKFFNDINTSDEQKYETTMPPKAISEVSDSPQYNQQTIDDIFAFIMDQELLL